jgi:glutamate-1-semialdehyde 2,1-aminomutase
MIMNTEKSKALFNQCQEIVPGGVNSNFRVPIYFDRAQGSRLWDVDGNEYVDCVVNNGACILGHGDPDIEAEVTKAVKQGLTSSLETPLSLQVCRQLHDLIPSAEQARLANSGTEAVMKALMIARAFTGREKIIKIEGAYHGWFDEAQVSVHPEPSAAGPFENPNPLLETEGVRKNTLDTVLVVPFNHVESLEGVLAAHKGEIAALLMEAVVFNSGCILPKPGYLEEVRRLTHKHGVVWILDEIITGFRLAPGGAQERFNVIPDVSVFAKAIANGWPLSAVVGRRDIMELSGPGAKVMYGGTYNGNQPTVAAASVCLEKVKDGRVQKHLQALTLQLSDRFNACAKEREIAARLEQFGGQFQVFFIDQDIIDYRSACTANRDLYRVFQNAVVEQGVWMNPGYLFHHGVNYAHSQGDIEKIIATFEQALDKVMMHLAGG